MIGLFTYFKNNKRSNELYKPVPELCMCEVYSCMFMCTCTSVWVLHVLLLFFKFIHDNDYLSIMQLYLSDNFQKTHKTLIPKIIFKN